MRTFVWSLISKTVTSGFAAVFIILLGNLIASSDLGIYVSATLVLTFSLTLLCVELGAGVVQKLNDVRLTDLRGHYFTAGLVGANVLGLIVFLLLLLAKGAVLRLFELEDKESLYLMIVPLILLEVNLRFFLRVLQADLKLKAQALISVVAGAMQIGAVLWFVYLGTGLKGIFAAVYIGKAVAVLGTGWIALRTHSLVFERKVLDVARDLFRFSGIIHLGTMVVFLDKNVDLFFVNRYLERHILATYNYALNISMLQLLFGYGISTVTYPMLTKAFTSENSADVDRIYSSAINYSFVLLSVGGLVLLAHLELWLPLVLPPTYYGLAKPLAILYPALTLFGSFVAVGTIFTAKGFPGYGLMVNVVALAINVVLCILFIPTLGMLGAALSTSISFCLRVIASMVLVERKVGTKFRYGVFFVSNVLFVLAVLLVRHERVPLFFRELSIMVYGTVVVIFLSGDKERAFLRTFKDRLLGRNADST